ncbi:MAG: hypothetical protein JOY70_09360, partial [Acidisphaera sp.]|nr:hypothetical protein [Acidisphaera sp.]
MILFVRGDLRSETGWGRATRALVAAIAPQFSRICGADLHYHPVRSTSSFGYPLLQDGPTCALFDNLGGATVLHACQPDQIRHVRGTVNVGWWFWETDRISPEFDWMERLESLDVLFVPSHWQAGWVASLGLRTPLHVLPWPHVFAPRTPHPAQRSDDVIRVCRPFSRAQLVDLDRVESAAHHDAVARSEMIAAQSARRRLADLPPESYLFAVQTDAPRKGL